ncbi:hybrid sensor histidine kinase/response regulator transcription factor [Pedobacter sp. AW31-3R]|uniref:hybrid sensor histidine kinase/response regulator transcription factor n=1 Tax=Pedobacter sp. AW31-3R TaxID=3445781 RepID=UPI003FA0DEE3
MSKKFTCTLFSLILLINLYTYSQITNLKFESIGTKDGLSQSNVHSIFQDKTGFIWFGTKDGLNRYDGYNFTVYKKSFKNRNSIRSNDIQTIIEDQKGILWMGTGEGTIEQLNTHKEQFSSDTFKSIKGVQCIYQDKAGNIWIGTKADGLFSYSREGKQTAHYTHDPARKNSLSSNDITCISEDREGKIWVGTSATGLLIFDRKTKTFSRHHSNPLVKNSLTDDHIRFVFEDSKANIWVGTYGAGLNLYRKDTKDFLAINPHHELPNPNLTLNYLLCMEEDAAGNLWVGTENGGLYIFHSPDNPAFSHLGIVNYLHSEQDNHSISSNTINAIRRDRSGNMWLGTSNAGVCMVNPVAGRFAHYRHEAGSNSLSNNIVNFFFEDAAQQIWIGTDGGGLNKFNEKDGTFSVFKHEPGQPRSICGNYVLTIAEDRDKNIWTGTWGSGISMFNSKNQYKHFKHDPNIPGSLSSNYAFYIFRDSKERIWVGTYGGGLDLYQEKTQTFKHFQHQEKDNSSISSNYILTIAEDKKGNLWIGTDGGGLNRFNEKEQNFVSGIYSNAGLSNDRIGSIYEDAEGYLWLATNFGLNRFNPVTNKNTTYFRDNGLANDVITSVTGDEKGNIWIGTNKGISRLQARTHTIKNYTVADGLQDNEFKYGRLVSRSGYIYFGGKNGFNRFKPEELKDVTLPSPVVFTSFQIFNKNVAVADAGNEDSPLKTTISQSKKITIPYFQSVFSFEFATLNYAAKEKKKYQYFLEGFDDKWHDLGNKNSVTFTNLDAGDYTLKVKGTNSDGQWSDTISEIQLVITPPFWKTWWFISIEILFAAGLVISLFYLRVAAIKRRNIQLEKEVALRTHELSETNSFLLESNEKIQVQNFYLEESNKEINRKTEKILNQQKHIVVQKQNLETTVNELQGSNKTKDKLFSILAHDLKNPVTALHGISEHLYKKLPQLTEKEVQSHTKDISNASTAIHELVINLLDWARTQSQNLAYEPVDMNIHELVMRNVFLAETQLTQKNISCHLDIDIHHTIRADKHMMDAVARNLINNSIKFTHRNGNITVTSVKQSGKVDICFADNGIGMTAAQIQEILFQENKSISYGTFGETGTRLGLQLIKEFIEINEGRLHIESEPHKGSAFTISLPDGGGAQETTQLQQAVEIGKFGMEQINFQQEQAGLLTGKRILIVDDNDEIRNFLKLLLSGTFELFEAANGKEGLKIATEAQPDLIITDMMMPVMNGLEFCNTIKSDYNTSHIPVVLLTSNTGEVGQLASYEAGSDAFLTKPINQKILFHVLLNLIKNQENAKKRFSGAEELLPEGISYNKMDEEFIDKVSSYIEQHINDADLDYKKLCEITAMSRTVLYAKFKALTGMGVHDFIKNIRLKKSLKLLQEGKLNISQIAYEVGFATPSYFSKSFVKRYEIGPKEYVAKLRAKSVQQKFNDSTPLQE